MEEIKEKYWKKKIMRISQKDCKNITVQLVGRRLQKIMKIYRYVIIFLYPRC